MVDEVDFIGPYGRVESVTIADGNALAKGTFLVLSDPNTGAAHSATLEIPVGVTTSQKVASDGQTVIGVAVTGDVDAVADGTITVGHLVVLGSSANQVRDADQGSSLSGAALHAIVGKCMETATDGERVRIKLMLA